MKAFSCPLYCAALILCAVPAQAATRTFLVTGFERIEASGPYTVSVRTGAGAAVKATGDRASIDAVEISVRGDRLVIDRSNKAWGAQKDATGPVTIHVSVPSLRSVTLSGVGSLAIDRVRGQQFKATVLGAGAITIAAVEIDRFDANLGGSGSITLAGHCKTATIVTQGNGAIDANQLRCDDVSVTASGAGGVAIVADRTAKVVSNGPGEVTVGGKAKCDVSRTGSGEVSCGTISPRR